MSKFQQNELTPWENRSGEKRSQMNCTNRIATLMFISLVHILPSADFDMKHTCFVDILPSADFDMKHTCFVDILPPADFDMFCWYFHASSVRSKNLRYFLITLRSGDSDVKPLRFAG